MIALEPTASQVFPRRVISEGLFPAQFGIFADRHVSHSAAHLGVNPPWLVVTSAAAGSVPPTTAHVTRGRVLCCDALGNAESTVLLVPTPSVSPALLCAVQTLQPAVTRSRASGVLRRSLQLELFCVCPTQMAQTTVATAAASCPFCSKRHRSGGSVTLGKNEPTLPKAFQRHVS